MTYLYTCPACGAEDIELDVRIDSPGHPGRLYGPPEHCYPAEPMEWHLEGPDACPECKAPFDLDLIAETESEEIEEKLAEPDDPPDPDEDDRISDGSRRYFNWRD